VIQTVRGLGMMIGVELAANIPSLPGDANKSQAVRMTNLLHAAGALVIPAGANILRLLPALNLTRGEADEGLKIIESVVAQVGA
jgi:acetylornithine/succinyldiaminopimelate/putrescine aminotransferase